MTKEWAMAWCEAGVITVAEYIQLCKENGW